MVKSNNRSLNKKLATSWESLRGFKGGASTSMTGGDCMIVSPYSITKPALPQFISRNKSWIGKTHNPIQTDAGHDTHETFDSLADRISWTGRLWSTADSRTNGLSRSRDPDSGGEPDHAGG
jgi:hypothetical protein